MPTKSYIFLSFFFLFCSMAFGQEVSIVLGSNQIALNEPFTITLSLKNEELDAYSAFPDIPGFDRAGTSTSSSTQWVNGRMSREMSLVQSYMPREEGSFRLKPFRIKVNGEYVDSEGTTIEVGPVRQQPSAGKSNRPRSLFDDLFGIDEGEDVDYTEVADNAFLAVTVDKKEVFVGEGFTITVAFYIPEKDPQVFAFYDLNNQLTKIIQQLKPENSWEENFQIYEVKRNDVEMNGERYGQYKLYQARYYPLNTEPVKFPALDLTMIKYKLAKSRSLFGPARQEAFKTFHSEPLVIAVKELPPHPLKEQVAVGDYQLKESLSTRKVETGESFSFNLSIVGQGNIAAINAPKLTQDPALTIYEPNESINTRKTGNTVIGIKQFGYYAIPNEPGEYNLGDYFRWIYFNSRTAQYDTLRPTARLEAVGASRKNETIMATDPGAFYENVNGASNELHTLESNSSLRWLANGLIFLMFAAVVYLLVRK